MAKQVINVGGSANDRTGDPLRIAFQKTNSNFTEVYTAIQNIGTGGSDIDRSWESSDGAVFDVVEWNSGSEVTIEVTPYETANLVTYDSRVDSEYVYFVWDQDFIDNVWNGYNTPAGEGNGYEISLDGGNTWYPVTTSGYNSGTTFYFSVPYDVQGSYTFTYNQGDLVLMRFNRGSFIEPWFDLENAPVSSNTVIAVDMSVVVDVTMQGDPIQYAKIFHPNFRFANALYDDNTGEGGLSAGIRVWSGSSFVEDMTDINERRNTTPGDNGRVYATFTNGSVGTMTFYWNAKLYTVT